MTDPKEAKYIADLVGSAHLSVQNAALVARDHVPELQSGLEELERQLKAFWIAADNATRGPAVAPVDRATAYENAIARAEQAFRKNKSRMWPLKFVRDYLKEELNGKSEE
jgi:hypothetical protein